MSRSLLLALLLVAGSCADKKPKPRPMPPPVDMAAARAAPCETLDTCALLCGEGAKMVKDREARVVACVKDGKKHGRVVAWYPNGKKQLDGFKRNGMAYGHWTNWHESGSKSAESEWKADKRISGRCWDRKGMECRNIRCVSGKDCL